MMLSKSSSVSLDGSKQKGGLAKTKKVSMILGNTLKGLPVVSPPSSYTCDWYENY